MVSKHYVLTWRSDINPGSIKIVGPFLSPLTASTWGKRWQRKNNDNPCWQVIGLGDDTFVRVRDLVPSSGPFLILPLVSPRSPEAFE